jgi:hypothetical protein
VVCGIPAESENARVPSMTVLVSLVECQAWLLEGHDIIAENMSLRTLAELEFTPNIRKFDKGREHYQRAVDLLKNTEDNYMKSILAFTHNSWGFSALRNNFIEEGNAHINIARDYYEDLEKNGYVKAGTIDAMMQQVQETMLPTRPLKPQTNDLRKEDSQEIGDKK